MSFATMSQQPATRRRFMTTRWNVVRAAGDSNHPAQEESLDNLLMQYLPALREFLISRFRLSEDHADDLIQSFALEKIIKKDLIQQAKEERGRFRTFLMTAISRFALSELRRAQAQKRIPPQALVSLEDFTGGLGEGKELAREEPPPEFNLAFTRQVLAVALERMRRHCKSIQRTDLYEVFHARMLKPILEDTDPEPYDQLVERFQLQSPDQASNLLISAKRIFARTLKSVVAEFARTEPEVEDELRLLRTLLPA